MTTKINIRAIFLFTLSLLLLSSCSNHKFKIKGELYGGEEKPVILEKADFAGRWLPVDSTRTNKLGGFSFSFPTPPSPEIYRLSANNQYVYIPVDSTETITITSSYERFGSDFSLSGTRNAELLAAFEKELQATETSNPNNLINFKRTVFSKYIKDNPGSILNFYILTKTIDGKALYDPADEIDRKYFGAVATGFKTVRPDDPHTALLEKTAINALKEKQNNSENGITLEAEEIALIDINLPNENGQNVKLSDITGRGKQVVVIFSLLNQPNSPELNIALAKIYNQQNGKTEFYNVSLDPDQYEWREAARNLPWITVYSPGENRSVDAVKYNVYQVPSFFIYNEEGELVSRPLTIEELEKGLK